MIPATNRSINIRFLSIVIMVIGTIAHAQETIDHQIQQISPLTPNAASLGKFGNTPVSYYTGIPNIGIPLYEIKVKDFTLPISLNYHAGGIKVDDVASWVGMGWYLNAGGMISRQQRGVEDYRMVHEKSTFYDRIETILGTTSSENEKSAAAMDLYEYRYDTESDIFSINAGSLSQKFFMDVDENIYCMPARKLSIIPESSYHYGFDYNRIFYGRWRVIDEKGIEYIFGKTLDDSKEEIEVTQHNTVCGTTTDNPVNVSSWYLNKIVLPTGEVINFSYDYFSFCTQNTISETMNVDAIDYTQSMSNVQYLKALRIKEITFPTGKIEFVSGDIRRDLEGTAVLDEIKIYSYESGGYELMKSFSLKTNNPDGNIVSGDKDFRLALLSVTEQDKYGSSLEPYIFEYKTQMGNNYSFGLPEPGSTGQDIWGFNNGKITNTGLVPGYLIRNENGDVVDRIDGADRSVVTDLAMLGILTKITYPTKGSTEFFYESNVAKGAYDHSDQYAYNPLNDLVNMSVNTMENKQSPSFSVENITGYEEAYGANIEVIREDGADVYFDSHIFGHGSGESGYEEYPPGGTVGFFYNPINIALEKKNISGGYDTAISVLYFGRSFHLDPGQYRVRIVWNDNNLINEIVYVNLFWQDYTELPEPVNDDTEMMIGGLRIAKIIDYDNITQQNHIRNYHYQYEESDSPMSGSSGWIYNSPVHLYIKDALVDHGVLTYCPDCLHITSFTNSPILQTEGGYVGYGKVTVSYGLNGELGKSVYTFTSPRDYLDENISASRKWPFNRTTSLDWRRGREKESIEYKYTLGSYIPVSSMDNMYAFNNNGLNPNYNLLVNVKADIYPSSFFGDNPGYSGKYSLYYTVGEPFFKIRDTISKHYPSGDLIQITDYHYDNPQHLQLTRTETINSKGEYMATNIFYPDDVENLSDLGGPYLTSLEKQGIDYLKTGTGHRIAEPVQIETIINGEHTVSRNNYGQFGDLVLPESVGVLKGNYELGTNEMEDRVIYHKYDGYGNPIEVSNVNGPHIYYLWGYNGSYPIAKIENLSFGKISPVVQNLMDDAISRSEMDNDHCRTVGCKEQDLRDALEALRADLPSDVLMTGYTHDPLIGVTSITDPKGQTIYFSYDSFNRLKEVRDSDGNLVTDYEYQYKGLIIN